jgi:hypothetical protein
MEQVSKQAASSLQVITKADQVRNRGTTKRKMLLILSGVTYSIRNIFLFVVPVFFRRSTFVITCNDEVTGHNTQNYYNENTSTKSQHWDA